MKICVVGLGKIGLPLAVQYASMGHDVIGADINGETVSLVNRGIEPFPGETGLQEMLGKVVDSGRLEATTDTSSAVAQSQVVVIVVPLFVDKESRPDFEWMDSATQAVGSGLQSGTLVIYETTLPVGTTRNRFAPMLSATSGLQPGRDFRLVFSPERVLTGRVFEDLRKYPKLVGGIDEESEVAGKAFYEAVLQFDRRSDLPRENGVWSMGSCEAAEMAKLAETTYRDVNIGLANQFARFADKQGIDVYAVIEACNSQPFSHIHQPGVAVGGHCIPVYPRLYLHNDPEATVVSSARAANAAMPSYAVELLKGELKSLSGVRVAILGAAYRGGVKETAFSGVFDIVASLRGQGAIVSVHDPLYSKEEITAYGWNYHQIGDPVDAVILHADHKEYAHLKEVDFPGARCVVDGRRILDFSDWKGTSAIRIGQPMSTGVMT